MERRILAELFVEDEKAIEMGKGIIDYAKGVIDYQCQECGISTGDMRILDDDDPEDAKASDLADKIFNSEKGEPIFVYVVVINSTIDDATNTATKVFSTREKAKAYFDGCVADEKANDFWVESDDKVLEESEDRFVIWQNGYHCKDHCKIYIVEREVC